MEFKFTTLEDQINLSSKKLSLQIIDFTKLFRTDFEFKDRRFHLLILINLSFGYLRNNYLLFKKY